MDIIIIKKAIKVHDEIISLKKIFYFYSIKLEQNSKKIPKITLFNIKSNGTLYIFQHKQEIPDYLNTPY